MSEPASSLPHLIRAEIAGRGPIAFAEFMALALYHPHHGYYSTARARIGRGGDFITSVSVGALFGRLMARQFVEIWARLERPAEFTIVEQGAHRAEFADDVLRALRELAPACFAATTYRILEPSAALAAAQRKTLAGFAERVRWASSMDELPEFTGVHFSNELLDAFPVHRVQWTGLEWCERCVGATESGLFFVSAPLTHVRLREHLARLPPVSASYETEVCLAAGDWVAKLAPKLLRGWVLAIDYGFPRAEYYRPERSIGTLTARAAQRVEPDPLARPGELDLTAHVDFTSLAEAAEAGGLSVVGYSDQHHFMVGLSRLHFADDGESSPIPPRELLAFKTLMHPEFFGRRFHAIGLAKGIDAAPPLAVSDMPAISVRRWEWPIEVSRKGAKAQRRKGGRILRA